MIIAATCRERSGLNGQREADAFERLFKKRFAIEHHRIAPHYAERERYLQHLIVEKQSHKNLRDTAALLLHVIRVLGLETLRTIDGAEITTAGKAWATEQLSHRKSPQGRSALRFNTAATGWLRHQGLLKSRHPFACRFDRESAEFNSFLIDEVGYRASTIAGLKGPTSRFLFWIAARHTSLKSVSYQDCDAFMDDGRARGWRPSTVRAYCLALRTFFRFAENRGWCKPGLSRAIVSPVVRKKDCEVSGPAWKDVRRMIKTMADSDSSSCRAKAILLLCSVYGLRNSEVTHLRLQDIDWYSETFVVRRAKRGNWQRFPLQQEVGNAIIQYLRTTRPRCICRNLFITLNPPFRPLLNLSSTVQKQMRIAGIRSQTCGTHSLRHACATELLRKGTSLQNIAAFLGHRDIRSVSVYAKYDQKSLRQVADFSLSSIL